MVDPLSEIRKENEEVVLEKLLVVVELMESYRALTKMINLFSVISHSTGDFL
jgi:hypothetical protein